MNVFYVLLPTKELPSVDQWAQRLQELEPGFSLDKTFNPQGGGVWECTYEEEGYKDSFCCEFSLESSAPLFEKAPELVELTKNCQAVAIFDAEEGEDGENDNLAASYALAEALLSLTPGSFLYDPFEGVLLYDEDGAAFFHDQLTIVEDEEE